MSSFEEGTGTGGKIRSSNFYSSSSTYLFQHVRKRVARNSQWGGLFGGLGAEPPAAEGQWGSGGEALSRRRHGGLEAEPPALENFAFFCKNNFILGLF